MRVRLSAAINEMVNKKASNKKLNVKSATFSKIKTWERTTKDLFDDCLHKYVITDAIRDRNVLQFIIEYIGQYKQKGNTFIDIEVEGIDTKEVIDSPKRLDRDAGG